MKRFFLLVVSLVTILMPSAAQTVTVTSPNGGEAWALNSAHNITWNSQNAGSAVVNITLRNAAGKVGDIKTGVALAKGGWTWPSAGTLENGTVVPARADYVVRINIVGMQTHDDSDVPFALTGTAPPSLPSITVLYPDAGIEYLLQGQGGWIEWTATNVSQNLRIVLITAEGADVGVIAENVAPNSSPCHWTIGQTQTGMAPAGKYYKVRISAMDGSIHDDSDNPVKIWPAVPVIVKAPLFDRLLPLLPRPKLAVTFIDLQPNPDAYFIVFGFKNAGNAPLPAASGLPEPIKFRVVIDGRDIGWSTLDVPDSPLAPGAEAKEPLGGFIKFPAPGDAWPFNIGNQITITLNENNVLGMGSASKTSSLRLIALHNFYDLALVPVTCDLNANIARVAVTKVGGGGPPRSKKFILHGTIRGYQPPGSVPHKWNQGVVETPGPFTIHPTWTILSTDRFPFYIDIPLAAYSPFFEFEFVIKPEFRDEFDERNNSLPLVRFDRPN